MHIYNNLILYIRFFIFKWRQHNNEPLIIDEDLTETIKLNSIVNILEKNRINYGYKIIPEAEISELLIGLENTASITIGFIIKMNFIIKLLNHYQFIINLI